MKTTRATEVTDTQLASLLRRQNEIYRRVMQGTLPIERILVGLQGLIEGNFPGGSTVIDCDAMPYIPDGWEIRPEDQISSAVRGLLDWDVTKVALHLEDDQKSGRVRGHELHKALEGQAVLPANILDWLLDHQEFIPEEWKYKAVFFWGTLYRDRDGSLSVRYLYWCGERWRWDCYGLGYGWSDNHPAAVCASF